MYKDYIGDDLVIEQVYVKGKGRIKEYTLSQAQEDFDEYIKKTWGEDYFKLYKNKTTSDFPIYVIF